MRKSITEGVEKMNNYWLWRYERDKKLGRVYCEPKRTDEEMERVIKESEEHIKKFISGAKFNTVLDFGCGAGYLCNVWENAIYVGVDIIVELIAGNRIKYPHKFFHCIGPQDKLIGFYELIFTKGVLQHFKDDLLLYWLNEFREHCSNLIIFSPHGSIKGELQQEGDTASAPCCRRPDDLRVLMESNGWRIVKAEDDNCKIWAVPK